jgi:hypothetical protein
MHTTLHLMAFLSIGLIAAGCSENDDGGQASPPAMDQGMPAPEPGPDPTPGCDPLQPVACSLPWPSNLYLEADESRRTGYTLNFADNTLPANVTEDHIDPTPYRRMDGYGLGTPIITVFPNLDITGFAGEHTISDSIIEDAPLVLLEVGNMGVRRIPYFAEYDILGVDPETRALIVRPAEILVANTRYVVAFRGLTDVQGEAIPPTEAFAALRDNATENWSDLTPRQARFDEIFAILEAEGISRDGVTLAWDFHTASTDALHGQVRHMWADAIERTGEQGPELVFDEIEEFVPVDDGSGRPVHPQLALRIQGHVEAPEYVKRDEPFLGTQGWVLNLDEDGLAVANGVREAAFWIGIPHAALEGEPHRLINHGHGFFGSGKEAANIEWEGPCGYDPPERCGSYQPRLNNGYGYITFSADLVGMSAPDRGEFALTLVTDFGRFPWISDYLHQGIVQNVLVTRAMKSRLSTMPELMERGIVIETDEVYFWGISMGAMFGPTVMALSPDIHRGVLGVASHNILTIMDRSTNFAPFFTIMQSTYPDRLNQVICQATIQLLWDATDGISYMRHLSAEPWADRQPVHVLADVSRGDPQVTPIPMENATRSRVGLRVMDNYDDERSVELVEAQAYPYEGSGLTNWHYGQPWAALGNQPPAEELGNPHLTTRQLDAMHRQMDHFFRTGEIIDVCDGGLCPAATSD